MENDQEKIIRNKIKGTVLVMCLVFLVVFAALISLYFFACGYAAVNPFAFEGVLNGKCVFF